jgi:hypothetical protein
MKPIEKIIGDNDQIYGLFNLTDLFTLVKGNANEDKDGDYPLITSSDKNKGAAQKTSSNKYENCFTISSNGSCGSCFWHPYKFDANSDATVAIPKFKIADLPTMEGIAAYVSKYLKYKRFSYGRKSGLGRLNKQLVAMPIKKDKIDWKFIHDSYKSVVSEICNKQKDQIQSKIDSLNVEFEDPEFYP